MTTAAGELPIVLWVVSVSSDPEYPNAWLARRWEAWADGIPQPTPEMLIAPVLEALEHTLARMGLVKLARSPDDDPDVLSTWV